MKDNDVKLNLTEIPNVSGLSTEREVRLRFAKEDFYNASRAGWPIRAGQVLNQNFDPYSITFESQLFDRLLGESDVVVDSICHMIKGDALAQVALSLKPIRVCILYCGKHLVEAAQVRETLEAVGYNTYFAECRTDVGYGEEFNESIGDALQLCDVVVFPMPIQFESISPYLSAEFGIAKGTGKVSLCLKSPYNNYAVPVGPWNMPRALPVRSMGEMTPVTSAIALYPWLKRRLTSTLSSGLEQADTYRKADRIRKHYKTLPSLFPDDFARSLAKRLQKTVHLFEPKDDQPTPEEQDEAHRLWRYEL